ncbi:MAG: tetratricopeptide repeat protein, partial [Actinomycetota bacterium]
GNPLFVEEMLAMLIDDGLLRFEDGAWRSVEDLANVTVPPTIHLLLAARLDRLDTEERAVIERGAVEGKVFHAGAVTTLSPQTVRPHVRSRLLALARKELIRPDRPEFAGEDAFRFRHLLIRDAAYQAMPKEQRAELHERFAGWLAEAARDRIVEYEEILAHHLEQAYRYRVELGAPDDRARELAARAAEHLYLSAVRADERADLASARSLLERIDELGDEGYRARALLRLSELLPELGEYAEAHETAVRAVAAADAVGDRASALRAELVRILNRGSIDPARTLATGRQEIEAVLAEAERLDQAEVRDRAVLALTLIAFWVGKSAEAIAMLDELSDRVSAMTRRDRSEVAAQLVICSFFGSVPVDAAFTILDRAAQMRGDTLIGEAHDVRVRGGILAFAGRFDEAHEAAERATALYQDLGAPAIGVTTNQVTADAMLLEGRPEDAERILREMHELYESMGETGFNSTVCGVLARALCDQGRFDEAEQFVERSRAMTAEDDFASQGEWRMAQARVLAERGSTEEALALADEATAIVDNTDYLNMQGAGHEIRGQILVAAGRGDDARVAFGEALDRYERKGNVVAAARIRARLDGLAIDGAV